MTIHIIVNDAPVDLEEDGALPLLHALRNCLELKGTRFGCGGEDCGACTVLVDGDPSYACTITLDAVAGRRVQTVEGLSGWQADILRAAFVQEGAGQCGYCLSGIVMTASTLLSGPRPLARADIKAALSRHLCRCGSHPGIIRAVERAVAAAAAGQPHA